jgi:HEAT repeat protein
MPWALVGLDPNKGGGPIQLQFLGRQRFTTSRKPSLFEPAGLTPRGRQLKPDKQVQGADSDACLPSPCHGEPSAQTREALRQIVPRDSAEGLIEQLRGSDQMHQRLHALQQTPSHRRVDLLSLNKLDNETGDAQASHRGRVLPMRFSQRQPSPRVPQAISGVQVPGLGLAAVSDGVGAVAMRSARRAAFTPRSQAQEDAKLAHRKSMVNGFMKKLMDKNWAVRKSAVEGLADIAMLENDSTVIDAVVQHLASRNDKARQAAIFAISRIPTFKGDFSIARHLLRLLEHTNPEVRQVAPVALGHVTTKGDAVSREIIRQIAELLGHHDRDAREAAVDALVQVAERGDKLALDMVVVCFADSDRMVRQVALEASEQIFDQSLSSNLAVLELLQNICQCPSNSDAKSAAFASSSSEESVHACRVLVSHISIPPSVSCPACSRVQGAELAHSKHGGSAKSTPGPFQQDKLCGPCVAAVSKHIKQRVLPKFCIAFCMGGHARLGRDSLVGALDTCLLPVILGFCFPNACNKH